MHAYPVENCLLNADAITGHSRDLGDEVGPLEAGRVAVIQGAVGVKDASTARILASPNLQILFDWGEQRWTIIS